MSLTKTILIFRTGQLGDTLVALPAIIAIKNSHPHHRLVLLTDVHNRTGYVSSWEVLEPLDIFDEVVFYRPTTSGRYSLFALFSLVVKLRRIKPDCVVSLMPVRSQVQAQRDHVFFRWFVGSRHYRSGGVTERPPANIDGTLPRLEPEWRRLLNIVDGEIPDLDMCFPRNLSKQDTTETMRILSSEGVDIERRLLAFGPGSKMPAKKWPLENYLELGKRLLNRFSNVSIVVVGGKEDREIGDTLVANWGGARTYNIVGQLSVRQAASALQNCTCYIGNDTGTMHLAASVGTPCVALFSARDYPGLWEPYGSGHVILRHDTKCAGCMLTVCNEFDNACLKRIKVEEAYHAACTILHTLECPTKLSV